MCLPCRLLVRPWSDRAWSFVIAGLHSMHAAHGQLVWQGRPSRSWGGLALSVGHSHTRTRLLGNISGHSNLRTAMMRARSKRYRTLNPSHPDPSHPDPSHPRRRRNSMHCPSAIKLSQPGLPRCLASVLGLRIIAVRRRKCRETQTRRTEPKILSVHRVFEGLLVG